MTLLERCEKFHVDRSIKNNLETIKNLLLGYDWEHLEDSHILEYDPHNNFVILDNKVLIDIVSSFNRVTGAKFSINIQLLDMLKNNYLIEDYTFSKDTKILHNFTINLEDYSRLENKKED